MLITTITEPTSEPITLVEAKNWLRVDASDEDAVITGLIRAARIFVEQHTRSAIARKSVRFILDAWPPPRNGVCTLGLSLAPVDQIIAIRVVDSAGFAQTAPAASYTLAPPAEAPLLCWRVSPPQPGVAERGVEIDAMAGYAGDIPPEIRQAILVALACLYERRGDGRPDEIALNARLREILAGRRRMRLA